MNSKGLAFSVRSEELVNRGDVATDLVRARSRRTGVDFVKRYSRVAIIQRCLSRYVVIKEMVVLGTMVMTEQ